MSIDNTGSDGHERRRRRAQRPGGHGAEREVLSRREIRARQQALESGQLILNADGELVPNPDASPPALEDISTGEVEKLQTGAILPDGTVMTRKIMRQIREQAGIAGVEAEQILGAPTPAAGANSAFEIPSPEASADEPSGSAACSADSGASTSHAAAPPPSGARRGHRFAEQSITTPASATEPPSDPSGVAMSPVSAQGYSPSAATPEKSTSRRSAPRGYPQEESDDGGGGRERPSTPTTVPPAMGTPRRDGSQRPSGFTGTADQSQAPSRRARRIEEQSAMSAYSPPQGSGVYERASHLNAPSVQPPLQAQAIRDIESDGKLGGITDTGHTVEVAGADPDPVQGGSVDYSTSTIMPVISEDVDFGAPNDGHGRQGRQNGEAGRPTEPRSTPRVSAMDQVKNRARHSPAVTTQSHGDTGAAGRNVDGDTSQGDGNRVSRQQPRDRGLPAGVVRLDTSPSSDSPVVTSPEITDFAAQPAWKPVDSGAIDVRSTQEQVTATELPQFAPVRRTTAQVQPEVMSANTRQAPVPTGDDLDRELPPVRFAPVRAAATAQAPQRDVRTPADRGGGDARSGTSAGGEARGGRAQNRSRSASAPEAPERGIAGGSEGRRRSQAGTGQAESETPRTKPPLMLRVLVWIVIFLALLVAGLLVYVYAAGSNSAGAATVAIDWATSSEPVHHLGKV